MKKKRLIYLFIFLILLTAEILIGEFGHGAVRSYLGDVLVVMLLWALVRIFVSEGCSFLPLGIFGVAVMIEILQGINILDLLGIENRLLQIALGSTFDWLDIAAYAIGCAIIWIFESFCRKYIKTSYL